jgi:hypothetical protein
MSLLRYALFALLFTWSATMAATSLFTQPAPFSSAALANDPVLVNHTSFDLILTLSEGDSWVSTGAVATLSSGSFYNHFAGDDAPSSPNLIVVFPALAYDTHVSSNGGPVSILGRQSGPGLALVGVGPTFDALWRPPAPLPVTGPTTVPIARLTIPNEALGSTFEAQVKTTLSPAGFNFNLTLIPEPSTAALVVLGLACLSRRQRRSAGATCRRRS